MSISFSRPDPSSPAAVGSAAFTVGRRGFDQTEVRDFLRMVSAELARLQERERFLERELRSAQTRAISEPGALTEDMVTELLGEETARILTAARAAAAQIHERAEEIAGRMIREASEDASRVRQEAEFDAQRMRSDAANDAQAEIEMARQQGTDMVNEARQYRERVLNELSKRRELAREQIEQLEHGRDRLMSTFTRARQATDDVISELNEGRDEEPDELIDLANTTGPIPVVRPIKPIGSPFDIENEADAVVIEPTIELASEVEIEVIEPESEPEVHAEAPEEVQAEAPAEVQAEAETEVTSSVFFGEDPTVSRLPTQPQDTGHKLEPDTGHVAEVVSIFGKSNSVLVEPEVKEIPQPAVKADPPEQKAQSRSTKKPDAVDDLFAKLRTSNTEQVVERIKKQAKVEPKTDVKTQAKVIKPAKVKVSVDLSQESANLGKKLKRVLADEQNSYLEFLRRKGASKKMSEMLADVSADVDRFRAAIEEELLAAAILGAQTVSAQAPAQLRRSLKSGDALDGVYIYLTDQVIEPVRKAVVRCLESSEGDTDSAATALRGVYRQWRNDRVEAIAADLCQMAFGRGAQNTTI